MIEDGTCFFCLPHLLSWPPPVLHLSEEISLLSAPENTINPSAASINFILTAVKTQTCLSLSLTHSTASMDSSASDFLLNSSALQSVYFQGRSESTGLLDLGLSLRTLQPEASYHPAGQGLGYIDLLSWPDDDLHTKNMDSGVKHSMLGPQDCDEESEGVQSNERWSYIKVNMDGIMVGRKICLLDHGNYLNLARQLEDMFGLRLFEAGPAFCLLYKDREERWRSVGDVPWKEFVESVKRLRIARKHESSYTCSSTSM